MSATQTNGCSIFYQLCDFIYHFLSTVFKHRNIPRHAEPNHPKYTVDERESHVQEDSTAVMPNCGCFCATHGIRKFANYSADHVKMRMICRNLMKNANHWSVYSCAIRFTKIVVPTRLYSGLRATLRIFLKCGLFGVIHARDTGKLDRRG